MIAILWISLDQSWKLEDVQAGLQVVVAVLCTFGIFAFSRFCWQLSSNIIKKNQAVALASLMSINTIGEAFDIIILLRQKIFRQQYWKLLAQSLVVVALTAGTIISGPIAKASTRVGSINKSVIVPGDLATRDFNSRSYGNVDWNATLWSLERANFPLDQLLDFRPEPNVTWLYDSNEWNNTWSMTCNKTENTPINLFDTGQCANLSVELPVTNSFFDYYGNGEWPTSWNSYALNRNSTWMKDAIIILTGWTYPGYDNLTSTPYSMTVSIVNLHIHGMAKKSSTSLCYFGPGAAQSASYTKVDCSLVRPLTVPDLDHYAYPDSEDYFALPLAYVTYYFDRFAAESNSDLPITMISPDELIRFYQTYIITKDIQWPQSVQRQLTVNISVVQVSSTFVAIGILFGLLVILGIINYGVFALRHTDVVRETPESKLDWIMQSILDESETQSLRNRTSRRSVVASAAGIGKAIRYTMKDRRAFENAKYGATTSEEVPLANYASPHAGTVTSPHDGTMGNPYNVTPHNSYNGPITSPYNGTMTSPPIPGYMTSPTMYGGYGAENDNYYNMNPYEASFAHDIQNPEISWTSDRRRGYHRLG